MTTTEERVTAGEVPAELIELRSDLVDRLDAADAEILRHLGVDDDRYSWAGAGRRTSALALAEIGPCPPWCSSYGHEASHWSGSEWHTGAGRRVPVTEPPARARPITSAPDGVLVNACSRRDSDAAISIAVADGGGYLTAAEALRLAADLLAAVDETEGTGETRRALRYFEDRDRDAHAAELLNVRRAQIRDVIPENGEVVKLATSQAMWCGSCGEWVDLPDGAVRKTKVAHAASHAKDGGAALAS
jgi:hypothetical protein